jgi:hypothetical protein
MAGDVRPQSRIMSHSESDHEVPSLKPSRKSSVVDPESKSTPGSVAESSRKRPSTEPVDYPRRRATIAVSFILLFRLPCTLPPSVVYCKDVDGLMFRILV